MRREKKLQHALVDSETKVSEIIFETSTTRSLMESKINEYESKYKDVIHEKETLESKLNEQFDEIVKLTSKAEMFASAQVEIKELRQSLARSNKKASSSKQGAGASSQSLGLELGRLREELVASKSRTSLKKAEVKKLEDELQKSLNVQKSIEGKFEEKIEGLQTEVKDLRSKLARAEAAALASENYSKDLVERHSVELQTMQQQLKKSRDSRRRRSVGAAEVEMKLAQALNQKEVLEKEIEQFKSSKSKEIGQLSDDLEAAKAALKDLGTSKEALQTEVENSKNVASATEERMIELESLLEVQKLEREQDMLDSKSKFEAVLESHAREIETLKQSLATESEAKHDLENQIRDFKISENTATASKSKEISELKHKLKRAEENALRSINLEATLNRVRKEGKESVSTYKNELKKANKDLEESRQKAKLAEEKALKLSSELDKLKALTTSSSAGLIADHNEEGKDEEVSKAIKKEIQNRQTALVKKEKKISDAENRGDMNSDVIQQLKVECSADKRSIRELQNDLTLRGALLRSECVTRSRVDRAVTAVAEAKEELKSLGKELDQVKQNLRTQRAAKIRAERANHAQEKEVKMLREKLSLLQKKQAEENLEKRRKAIASLERELSGSERILSSLGTEVGNFDKSILESKAKEKLLSEKTEHTSNYLASAENALNELTAELERIERIRHQSDADLLGSLGTFDSDESSRGSLSARRTASSITSAGLPPGVLHRSQSVASKTEEGNNKAAASGSEQIGTPRQIYSARRGTKSYNKALTVSENTKQALQAQLKAAKVRIRELESSLALADLGNKREEKLRKDFKQAENQRKDVSDQLETQLHKALHEIEQMKKERTNVSRLRLSLREERARHRKDERESAKRHTEQLRESEHKHEQELRRIRSLLESQKADILKMTLESQQMKSRNSDLEHELESLKKAQEIFTTRGSEDSPRSSSPKNSGRGSFDSSTSRNRAKTTGTIYRQTPKKSFGGNQQDSIMDALGMNDPGLTNPVNSPTWMSESEEELCDRFESAFQKCLGDPKITPSLKPVNFATLGSKLKNLKESDEALKFVDGVLSVVGSVALFDQIDSENNGFIGRSELNLFFAKEVARVQRLADIRKVRYKVKERIYHLEQAERELKAELDVAKELEELQDKVTTLPVSITEEKEEAKKTRTSRRRKSSKMTESKRRRTIISLKMVNTEIQALQQQLNQADALIEQEENEVPARKSGKFSPVLPDSESKVTDAVDTAEIQQVTTAKGSKFKSLPPPPPPTLAGIVPPPPPPVPKFIKRDTSDVIED